MDSLPRVKDTLCRKIKETVRHLFSMQDGHELVQWRRSFSDVDLVLIAERVPV